MRDRAVAFGMVPMLAVLVSIGVVAAWTPPLSLARFSVTSSVPMNTLRAGTWYILHNIPTPPIGTTTAQIDLTMNATLSTQATLFNYDTNADAIAGRRIQRTGTGPGDTTLARYANWRSPTFAAARTISGTVVVRIWAGITGFPLNSTGTLVVYLRDLKISNGTYVEIANATLTDANFQGGVGSWVMKTISIPVASYSMAANHQLELKIETTAASSADMVIAYDTTAFPAALVIP
jgi:hypothetical protein